MKKALFVFSVILNLIYSSNPFSAYFIVFLLGIFLIVVPFFSGAWQVAIIGICLSAIFLPLLIKNFKAAYKKAIKESASMVER